MFLIVVLLFTIFDLVPASSSDKEIDVEALMNGLLAWPLAYLAQQVRDLIKEDHVRKVLAEVQNRGLTMEMEHIWYNNNEVKERQAYMAIAAWNDHAHPLCGAPSDKKVLVVGFPGTKYSEDVIRDLKASRTLAGGAATYIGANGEQYKVPFGFWKRYQEIIVSENAAIGVSGTSFKEKIIHFITPEISEIFFVGHSLGGAVASLCALDIFNSYEETVGRKIKMKLITFGAPRSFGTASATDFQAKWNQAGNEIFRFVNYNDFVQTLPLHIEGWKHVGPARLFTKEGSLVKMLGTWRPSFMTTWSTSQHRMYPAYFNSLRRVWHLAYGNNLLRIPNDIPTDDPFSGVNESHDEESRTFAYDPDNAAAVYTVLDEIEEPEEHHQAELTCTLPTSQPGYVLSSSATLASCTNASCASPIVTGVTCDTNAGYIGIPTITGCAPNSSIVTLTGCAIPSAHQEDLEHYVYDKLFHPGSDHHLSVQAATSSENTDFLLAVSCAIIILLLWYAIPCNGNKSQRSDNEYHQILEEDEI